MKLLNSKLFTVIVLIFLSLTAAGKTINMDSYLKAMYANKEYDKCYKLSKIVSSNRYSEYILSPYNIKYKESYIFLSDSAKYYEYNSLKKINLESFYYFYVIKNAEVSQYFSKEEIYPAFIKWVDSLYNSPITDGGDAQLENMITKKYKYNDDIPVVKEQHLKNSKLLEIYKFLKQTDSLTCSKIFSVDNKGLIELIKNRQEKDLLNLPSNDFNIPTCHTYGNKEYKIQRDMINYLDSLFKVKRFLCKEQISEFLYVNTNFTDEEKMFVTYYFISKYIMYNISGKFTNSFDIDRIILYRHTVCNGNALLMNYFLNSVNIKCLKITLETEKYMLGTNKHANNLVILNNKIYYIDATWNIYYKHINTFPDTKIITEWQLKPINLNYKNIKDLSYIIDVEGYDIGIIKELKTILNKKGA